jgi:hypothetical protein
MPRFVAEATAGRCAALLVPRRHLLAPHRFPAMRGMCPPPTSRSPPRVTRPALRKPINENVTITPQQ